MAKTRGGKISKYRKDKIKRDIRELFDDGSIMYYSERQLASKFDVARQTIKCYIEEVVDTVDKKDIKFIALELKGYLEQAISDIKYMWERSKEEYDQDEIRKNIDMMFKAIDKFTDFMERFFIKDKTTENINLKADITQRSLNINLVTTPEQLEQIKNGSG